MAKRPEQTLVTPPVKTISEVISAADALMNTPEDNYPKSAPYADAVEDGPRSKPRSISKNNTRSQ